MKTRIFNRILRVSYGKIKMGLRTSVFVMVMLSILMSSVGVGTAQVSAANIVGQGFTVTPADLAFILKQIKIAERHSRVLAGIEPGVPANPNPSTDPVYCQSMIGLGADQVASPLLSFGLRTVDGMCNNLQPGQAAYGAADLTFPRLTTPEFGVAEDSTVPGIGPVGPPGLTSYAQVSGSVVDSEPRLVSNLIVDQTSTNPAAVAAAGFPVRSQGNLGVVPCITEPTTPGGTDGLPLGCVPQYGTLFIPNVTTDVGLSPPFNGLFTIFGQFFDHGLDKITNGGNGAVFIPLKSDDPLIAGDDHIFGTADDLPANLRFMVMTRGKIVTGTDGFRNSPNTDTPFVDQSQTYTSHSSHQILLREYVTNIVGRPVSTGKFLSSTDGGLANWAMIKNQAATLLGLQLVDANVGNIPMIASDPYGNFIPGPARGLPQYVTASGLVEGNTASPVLIPANAVFINTAFLNDIAHSAAPTATPDADSVAGGSLDVTVPDGSYDNELLDLHFICGDGRCNENIALSAVHQVFHSEHDRLVDDIKNTLTNDTSGITNLADWQLALGADGWNGERLFQAARFVTEMEYQHLVFEEFARKVQPLINPFQPFAFNQTDVDPAITAEFAHAVYRFGHSMLTEDIDRINADGSRNDIALFDGFLNPAEYYDGGSAGQLTSQEAAGSIFMGMSDQVGNEIDEFVTDVLRNHLVGLPLDLAAINMTRARSEGVPSLNNFRKQVFAQTNDGQLTPYPDWVDFGQALKHPESLVNFVAAYGKHPIITSQTTIVGKRTAADQIVNGTILPGPDTILGDDPLTLGVDESLDDINPPADSADFMFSTGAWTNGAGNVSITGVDDIDLWMGGLAEHTNLFGGLLGSTFNYVFENQLTNLQNGDRFYYLARTPGMNLRAQLEGNSFSELVMRNTNAHTLKADPFATADCKFELGNLAGTAAGFSSFGSTVADDQASECEENLLLLRMPNGTIRYRLTNSVDPAGINGQAVYNGAPGVFVDRIFGGADNDTFWGGAGNDIIEGGDGADIALGGEGNDIITDLAGDDVPKGGPGNDAIDAGPGLDIIMGGDGKDFTNGGANINETFGGEGDDFIIAGSGEDAVLGDSGDDWAEGGDQTDLLIGDSSTLFFDDHNLPGHDVLIGQGGDDDYDGEGGDDIFVAGPGVEKNAGASGYDWSIGLGDPQPQNADLSLLIIAGQPPAIETRDKFNELEALSGWNFNDILRGDDVVPGSVGGGGFIGCDALDAAGVARIAGLDALVPSALLTLDSAAIAAASATHFCMLTGNAWGDGNILLGGSGSDLIEGRGANDIIDGDKYVNVRLSVRNNLGTEIGSTDLMEHAALSGNFGAGTSGMTLQQAVFAGLVDPGNIFIVREILSNPGPSDIDTALFSGPSSDYTITANLDGSVTVNHTAAIGGGGGGGGGGNDGIDTLWNIEQLAFIDGTFPAPGNLCKVLTLGHTGSGTDPVAAPLHSFGCAIGAYLPGESISLNGAVADAGFQIFGWTGTNNNSSTAATNTVTMPTANHSVSVDYVDAAPAVVSSVRLNANPTSSASVSFIVTFSESVTGVDNADFNLNPTVTGASVTSVSGTGATRTVTVGTGTGIGALRLNVSDDGTIQDTLGNVLGGVGANNGNFTAGEAYTIDRTSPTVLSSLRLDPSPTNLATVNFNVSFSEAVTGVDGADFSLTLSGVTGASITGVTGTGSTRSVAVNTGTGSGTILLNVLNNGSITDIANNALSGVTFAAGQSYTIDKTILTVVSSVRANTNPTNLTTVNFTVTFSEVVTGVDAADFSLSQAGITGASVTDVSGTGATRNVAVSTGTGNGTLRLNVLNNGTIRNAVNNALSGATFTAGQIYTVDKISPLVGRTSPTVVSSLLANPNPSSLGTVNFTVTFSNSVTGVDTADFDLTLTGVTGASVTGVSGTGATRTVTVSTGTGVGELRLNVSDDDTIQDALGNVLGGFGGDNGTFTAGEAYTIDRAAPEVISSLRLDPSPTNLTTVNFTVSFTEDVIGVDAADFNLTLSGVTGASVTGVTGTGSTRNVAVSTGTGSGTILLSVLNNGSIADIANNVLSGETFEAGQSYTIDKTTPTVVSSVRTNGQNPIKGSDVGFTLTFSEAVTGVDAADFSLSTIGLSGASVKSVTGSGATRSVIVNTGTGNGTMRLDVVNDSSIKDMGLNSLGTVFTSGQVVEVLGDTIGVFRPSATTVFLKNTQTPGFSDASLNFGITGDSPVMGDWDGNGTDTIGVYRNGVFYLRNSNSTGAADIIFVFGLPGDQPVTGDWDGDGIDTIGLYRGSTSTFYLRNSNSAGAADTTFVLGNPGDIGIAGDWNGDGLDTTGVFRPSNGVIFLKNTNTSGFADEALNYGLPGDEPVMGDWNNDGIDTIGVYRDGEFLLRNSNTNGFAEIVLALGINGDIPLAGNWDGHP